MTTPVDERGEPRYPPAERQRSSSTDTTVGDDVQSGRPRQETQQGTQPHLNVRIEDDGGHDRDDLMSPSRTREQAHRLEDDLAMLKVERQVSHENSMASESQPVTRSRSRRPDPVDEFDTATNPLHEKAALYRPPENPNTNVSKLFKKIHESSFLVRYFCYIVPVVCIILIPLLLGFLLFPRASVGGVKMAWFCVWLMIFWLTLWAGRILAKCLPWPIGTISSLFTNNSKKWRDMGKQLEIPATLFFWWLAIEISFLPTMTRHHIDGDRSVRSWQRTTNKVIVAIFVGMVLNFVEKIIIQLIAISFHLRTYQDRIELNKFQIESLAKLYKYSKEKIAVEDSEFEQPSVPPSGTRTPGMLVEKAQKNTKEALNKFGDVAGKIAGDFTGREVAQSNHPNQIVLALLNSNNGSQVLARRLYRTFGREETQTVHSDDLKSAFASDEEAEAAFSMFDKDMNGDISMEELEAVCVEIGRERKSITASLKDLDSVVSKLDDVFLFIVVVITILVFVTLISESASGVLTSAGSTLLALSWLFSATAQEFLQSIIFVFVKHPFDVGDRVSVYGNTGALGRGDDYFVKEIALLYTEFKKMEGQIVQAPNSYLNTLFILNQRRSGGQAEAVPVVIKFGTTLDQIDQLRQRLLEFVRFEKREYQNNILTELREVSEAHSLTLNVVFFYKSNWQNELLRLQRRNKFICALMVTMQELGIEGPRMRYPGQKESFPVYLQNIPHLANPSIGHGGTPDNPSGHQRSTSQDQPFVAPPADQDQFGGRIPSIMRTSASRPRGESLAAMGRRVDFSLGMKDISSGDLTGDVFESRSRSRVPVPQSPTRGSQERRRTSLSQDTATSTSVAERGENGPQLRRIVTDSSEAGNRGSHRNRFFGRNRNRGETNTSRMEEGMSDIPEYQHAPPRTRMDPRTGTFSPLAVRSSIEERLGTSASGALPARSFDSDRLPRTQPGPPGAQGDNVELRRLP